MAAETELEEREPAEGFGNENGGFGCEERLSTSMKDEKRSSSEGRSSEEGGAPEEEMSGSMNMNIDMSSERDRRWKEEGMGSGFGLGFGSEGGTFAASFGGGSDFSIGLI